MPTASPILPTIIAGPAIVTWNGNSYYTKTGVRAEFKRETFKITTDTDGEIDERMKAQSTDVTIQPVGMTGAAGTAMAAYYPYGVGAIGRSLFGATNLPLAVVTKFGGANNAGQTITYPRAALTRLPALRLRATDTLFGEMSFTCLGDPTVQPNGANAWETIADAAFADASFNETQIVTDIYTAAYGGSPYNAMGSMGGFEVNFGLAAEAIDADDFGHVDLMLKSLTATARFAPSNLTQAQVAALLSYQDTGYIFPGQSPAKAGTDLVIAGSGRGARMLSVTIHQAGPKQGGFRYATGKHRLGTLGFMSRRTWTNGAANPLWTITVS
jgi:hypothetical protein